MTNIVSLLILFSFSLAGFIYSEFFAKLKDLIVPLLAVIMLSMGLTLQREDFTRILKEPVSVLYGAFLQYTVMPLSALTVASLIGGGKDILTGFVLVGSAPGGTASNLITFLAGGNLPYSISMTALSTLLSPLITPLWTLLLAGKYVEVPFLSMMVTTLKIIVLPVTAGMLIRGFIPVKVMNRITSLLPLVAVFSISLIIAVIFALNKKFLADAGFTITAGVVLHILIGFSAGFLMGKLLKLEKDKTKALAIEVGIQNSGLSAVLAMKFFSPAVAVPSALFSLLQNILGILISLILRRI